MRVLKPGGVLYIDHEACSSYWNANQTYQNYLEELGASFRQDYLLILELPDDRKSYTANLIIRMKRALAKGTITGFFFMMREISTLRKKIIFHGMTLKKDF